MPNQEKENKRNLNEGYQPKQLEFGFQPKKTNNEIPKPNNMKTSLQSKPQKKKK